MSTNASKILEKLKGEENLRRKKNLYLNHELYEEFKIKCGKASASRVVEELMREFIESSKVSKKDK